MMLEADAILFKENLDLLNAIKAQIAWHESYVQECTCTDRYYSGADCWYRLSDKEQTESRIDHLIRFLTDMKEALE